MLRYFAKITDTSVLFESRWQQSWQVFDREEAWIDGSPTAIAMGINKATALKIAAALNNFRED